MDSLGIFSEHLESLIKEGVDAAIEKIIAVKLLDEDTITQQEVLKKYKITDPVLKTWRKAGLKRYEPPIRGTRSLYYRKSEIEKFLGMK
ncbi:hypothetical protein GU334_05065 [Lactococcus raffinolactis]|jgi:hypothetical protein|uniref:Helix-turn-helix domain-containing protein n=1 Tax=Pseudolactococcus raffinolactis TaxID=1366 RepID=A0AAE7CS75_9LACT|nr:long-chain fatty acid--CoA ligase [Lactococcus raffinolactis]QIW58309.1 hypothetical protein GU334_05065 [Lactococcus raffinolactis]